MPELRDLIGQQTRGIMFDGSGGSVLILIKTAEGLTLAIGWIAGVITTAEITREPGKP